MLQPFTNPFKTARQARAGEAPGPSVYSLFTSALRRDPLHFGLSLTRQYGDVVRIQFLHQPIYIVNYPAGIKHVLQENARNYSKDILLYKIFKPLLGNGLVTNDGESWLHQRRLVQPAFHRDRLRTLSSMIIVKTLEHLERWQDKQTLDIAREMSHLSLAIAGKALFNIDLDTATSSIGQAVTVANRELAKMLYTPFAPLHLFLPFNRRLQAASRTLERVVYAIISRRRQEQSDRGDLLSMLLLARDEATGQGMDDRQIHDEVMTLLIAGHETVATTLTWMWYLLGRYPDVERRLHQEAQGEPSERPYTQMVLEETLRIYPPAWIFARKALAADEIGGYRIPAQSVIILSPYLMHHHPAFWEHPESLPYASPPGLLGASRGI